ncbi:MAG: hypothetical protein QOD84_2653, partial [Acidobacteriaceae bacterium]
MPRFRAPLRGFVALPSLSLALALGLILGTPASAQQDAKSENSPDGSSGVSTTEGKAGTDPLKRPINEKQKKQN